MRLVLLFLIVVSCYAYGQTSDEFLSAGISKADLKDFTGAITDFTKTIELNPQHASAYFLRGSAKMLLKGYDGAIVDYTKAIEIKPTYVEAYYGRGLIELLLGRKDKGCSDLMRARELGSSDANDEIVRHCK